MSEHFNKEEILKKIEAAEKLLKSEEVFEKNSPSSGASGSWGEQEKKGEWLKVPDSNGYAITNGDLTLSLMGIMGLGQQDRLEEIRSDLNALHGLREENRKFRKTLTELRREAAKDVEENKLEYASSEDEDEKDQIARSMAAPEYIVALIDLKFPELKPKSDEEDNSNSKR